MCVGTGWRRPLRSVKLHLRAGRCDPSGRARTGPPAALLPPQRLRSALSKCPSVLLLRGRAAFQTPFSSSQTSNTEIKNTKLPSAQSRALPNPHTEPPHGPGCVSFRIRSTHGRRTPVTAVLFLLGIQHPQIPGAPPRTPSSIPHHPHPVSGVHPRLRRCSAPRPAGPCAPAPQAPGSAPSRGSAWLHPARFIASSCRFGEVRREIQGISLPGSQGPSKSPSKPCLGERSPALSSLRRL